MPLGDTLLRPVRAVGRTATRRPSLGGILLGVFFWLQSVEPTLMPRTPVTQAAAGAVCLLIGYGLGTLVSMVVHRLLARNEREISDDTRRRAWQFGLALVVVIVVLGPVLWLSGQRNQRAGMSMDSIGAAQVVPMMLLTALLTIVLMMICRGIGAMVRSLRRWLARRLPPAAATPATALLVVVVLAFVVWPALSTRFATWADTSFGLVDGSTSPGTEQPTADTVSGSPASLADWNDLGRHGSDFVAGATPVGELEAVHGAGAATEPIRVYVGLDSADSAKERAELAVAELDRTGAFDREVLAVVTSTGSGWVDPDAAEALEQLYAGDTAIVSQQYSFLPSWIATLLAPDASAEASSYLFEAVHARWKTEPDGERPKLLVFGLSLGSLGTEQAFAGPTAYASLAHLTDRTDGVLLVGPTAGNPIWRQLTDARDAASPVWRPVVDDGRVVRFDGRAPLLRGIDPTWEAPRLLYVQHPTDPVTFWDATWFWKPPEWMDEPRGEGVTDRGRWFPIVTGVQGVFDLMAGFGAPPGYGHDYRLDYVRAWAQVAPPDGWDDADTEALEARLHDG